MTPKPLSQIVEIPDPSLNEKLVAANDNEELTALSRGHLEAESILAQQPDDVEPSRSPFLVAAVLALLSLVFGLWYQLA